jgi:hypothetical protein
MITTQRQLLQRTVFYGEIRRFTGSLWYVDRSLIGRRHFDVATLARARKTPRIERLVMVATSSRRSTIDGDSVPEWRRPTKQAR